MNVDLKVNERQGTAYQFDGSYKSTVHVLSLLSDLTWFSYRSENNKDPLVQKSYINFGNGRELYSGQYIVVFGSMFEVLDKKDFKAKYKVVG